MKENIVFKFNKNGTITNKRGMVKLAEVEKGTVVTFPKEIQFIYHIACEQGKKTDFKEYWGKKKKIPFCPLCGGTFE